MNIGECKSVEEAAQTLLRIRSFAPFKYGGTWYVSVSKGEGVAYRSKSDLCKRLSKDDPATQSFPIGRVD